jgi:3-deoxy-D-manno-octulosonic-acid transferase
MTYVFDAVYLLVLAASAPWLAYKALTTGKYRRGLWAKLTGGAVLRDGSGSCAWFHGVSVGEIHLLRPVIRGFRDRHPDWDCIVSTTTDTGYRQACECFPDLAVCYWPLDFSWAVRTALRRVNPSLVVLAESEFWPNFLAAARRRGVPIAVINGRMSPRSLRNYARLGWLRRRLFDIDLICAQNEEYADHFKRLGAPAASVFVTGSVKYDGVAAENSRTAELARLLKIGAGDLVWIAGSTQAPEEEISLAIYRRLRQRWPMLRLCLVPRQRDRFDEVASMLARSGQTFVRRSQVPALESEPAPVMLIDTIGELGSLWPLATVAFVGGSLDGHRGGQNMIEPAAMGLPVLFGPHVWNFRETAQRLIACEAAIQVQDETGLESALAHLLASPAERQRRGHAGKAFVESQRGACGRTLDCLDRLIMGQTIDLAA